jgi:hypothetical protein
MRTTLGASDSVGNFSAASSSNARPGVMFAPTAGPVIDALGSTVEVTGPDGMVANSYAYDPYGGLLSAVETIPMIMTRKNTLGYQKP